MSLHSNIFCFFVALIMSFFYLLALKPSKSNPELFDGSAKNQGNDGVRVMFN